MKMLKKALILMVILEMFALRQVGYPSTSAYGDEVIPLRLKAGMITEAVFPDKIADVIKGSDSGFLQIEAQGNRMYLLPKENFDSLIYVITADNVSYCLHLIMDGTQAPVQIKIKKPLPSRDESQNKETLNTVELLKALLTGRQPAGAISLKLQNRDIFKDAKFRITADKVYELPGGVKAYVLTFENLTSKPVVVPIEHLELPGLLAISVDSQMLEARPGRGRKKAPGHTTAAYMIVEGQTQ